MKILIPLFCLALVATASAENPRDQLITDPESPKLSYSGFIFKGDVIFTYASRSGTFYSGPDSGGKKQGKTTAVFGAGGSVSYDNADKSGIYHFIPGFGIDIYPFEDGYNYYHASGNFFFCLSNRYQSPLKERRYFGCGPTLNLLIWQLEQNAVQRVVWGFGMNGGMAVPYNEKEVFFVELRLAYHQYDTDHLDDNLLMNEDFLVMGIGIGYGF